MKSFILITYETMMSLLFLLPRYSIFNYIKKVFLVLIGAKVGKRVIFYPGVWINTGRNLIIGDDVDFAKDVLITTEGGVEIGDRTLIGYRTQILSVNHSIPPVGERIPISGDVYKTVHIANDVWIGAGCIILPGVTIGEGAIIAAGSVVTKDIQENTIAAGIPAKVIRVRINA